MTLIREKDAWWLHHWEGTKDLGRNENERVDFGKEAIPFLLMNGDAQGARIWLARSETRSSDFGTESIASGNTGRVVARSPIPSTTLYTPVCTGWWVKNARRYEILRSCCRRRRGM